MTMPFDGYGLIQEIDVRLTVELGRKNLPLRELLTLGENRLVELDRLTDEPLNIMVNGRLIARGERIEALYVTGHWLDGDDACDLAKARNLV